MSVVNWRQEVTSGCQSLDPRLPGSRASVCVCGGGLFFGPSSSPLPSCPCYSEALERKSRYRMQSTETTMKHSKSQMLRRNGDHTTHGQVGPTSTSTPCQLQDGRRKTDPV